MITFMPAFLVFTACFLFAIIRPKMAIYLPIVFSSAYLVKVQVMGLPSTLLEVIIIAVLSGVWLGFLKGGFRGRVGAILSASWRMPLQRSLLCGIALFLVTATISALIAPHPHVAWGFWKAMVVEPIIYALTLFVLIEKEKRAQNIVNALFAGGVVSVGLSLVNTGFGVDFWRFRGIYDVPNSLALIVAPLCAMGLIGLFAPPTRWSNLAPPRRWLGALTLLFCAVLVATQSLAGLMAVAVTVFGAVIFLKRGWKILVVLGLIFVFGFGLQAGTGKLSHLLSRQSSSLIARGQIWFTATRMIKQHPILGTGLGTFEPNYQNELRQILKRDKQHTFFACTLPAPRSFSEVGGPVPCVLEWVVRDPHNVIMSFWLNTGLMGLLSMIWLIVVALKRYWVAFNVARDNDGLTMNASNMLFVAFCVLLIMGLFDVPYWKNDLALIWWVLLLVK